MECPVATEKRGKSFIRGWQENNYLLLDIPKFGYAFPVSTYVNANWVVRFVRKGKVVGFKARGKDVIAPYELFVLHYPEKLEARSLRRLTRAQINIPVLIHTDPDRKKSEHFKGMSLDISAEGIGIKLTKEIKKMDVYFLSFYLPSGETFRDVESKAVKTIMKNNCYEIGMQFIDLQEKHKRTIENCLKQYLGADSVEDDFDFGK